MAVLGLVTEAEGVRASDAEAGGGLRVGVRGRTVTVGGRTSSVVTSTRSVNGPAGTLRSATVVRDGPMRATARTVPSSTSTW